VSLHRWYHQPEHRGQQYEQERNCGNQVYRPSCLCKIGWEIGRPVLVREQAERSRMVIKHDYTAYLFLAARRSTWSTYDRKEPSPVAAMLVCQKVANALGSAFR
jgi:hypothetical protein